MPGKADPVGPGLTFDADDDFLGGGAKPSNLPDFSDLDKQLQQEDPLRGIPKGLEKSDTLSLKYP